MASEAFHAAPLFADEGLLLGIGTVLARVRSADGLDASLDIDGNHDRIVALLAIATRGRVPLGLPRHLGAAAKHWQRGDKALAHIRLAHARIPRLESEDDAYRLFLADELLAAGFEPDYLLKELSLPAAQIGLLKYPGQPHVPSGNGRKSGEFGSGQQGGSAPTPAFLEVPIPFELPLEPVIPFGVRPGPPVTLPPTAPVPSPDRLPNPDEADPNRNQRPKTNHDGDEPKVCPAPVPDVRRGPNATADQFEIDVHNTVNADNPLKLGEAIFYHGVFFDDCARKNDPLGRWKAGDMIEAKGPTYDKLINSDFSWVSASWGLLDQAERQNMAVEGTGRRDVYLVAELGAVEDMKKLFVDFDNIDVFHVAPVTPVPKARSRKIWLLSGDMVWI